MHDEDCRLGLEVENSMDPPDRWTTYGDDNLLRDGLESDTYLKCKYAVQWSVWEVYNAWDSRHALPETSYMPLKLAPIRATANNKNAPLFRVRAGAKGTSIKDLERRKSLTDTSSWEYISAWDVESTTKEIKASGKWKVPSGES